MHTSHTKGVLADDSALNWSLRPRKSMPARPVTAIVTGSGADLDGCQAVAAILCQGGKFNNDALAYPNAEMIRKLLVNVLPADAIVLIPHDTFGMDLGPRPVHQAGFAPSCADVVGIDRRDGGT
jgi:electron transfer flavoprotein alpha subunit